jgi:hypothetical protein
VTTTIAHLGGAALVTPSAPQKLLISVLSLGRQDHVLHLLENMPGWLVECGEQSGCICHLVIRNNDPQADFAACAARIAVLGETLPQLRCTLLTGGPNTGFGGGHNANIGLDDSDYILILNDDLGFPHMQWLATGLRMLREDAGLACIGAEENPNRINPLFGNGVLPENFAAGRIAYTEASILLFARRAYDMAGGFNPDYAWAMCEDADLSLRVQQLGFAIAHMPIPHQHWRSTSFNALPSQVKSSILEHNRAAFFANWGDAFSAGTPARWEVFDLWSDGLGDVFCALPHVLARLAPLSPERLATVILNISHPELASLLALPGLRVTHEQSLAKLRAFCEPQGIATLRSMRDVNFSLPFNIHAALAGALGIPPADGVVAARFAAQLKALPMPFAAGLKPGTYCAFHTEFKRDHDGRALSPAAMAQLLQEAISNFGRVALLGHERQIFPQALGADNDAVIDLQGRLAQVEMIAVVAQAGNFIGIDSFPAHIAAAAGVPSAVFFGAVHPLSRSWTSSRLWPLHADLDCIGCYHHHLEPSVPFCMRRDQACTAGPPPATLQNLLRDMAQGVRFNWAPLEARFIALQAGMLRLLRHHPAPPERLFRPMLAANEQISNLLYAVTEQVGRLFRKQYQSAALTAAEEQLRGVQSDLFLSRIALDEARAKLAARGGGSPEEPSATRILQLGQLKIAALRCDVIAAGQRLEVTSGEEDPQLLLPVLRGRGARVQLRLTVTSSGDGFAQIYWAKGEEEFSSEQVRSFATTAEPATVALLFDLAPDELLRLRVDPITGPGEARLQGSIGGMFFLANEQAAPMAEAVPQIMPMPSPTAARVAGSRRARAAT